MRRTFLLPLLVLAAGVAAVAGPTLAQNGEGGVGREECTGNTSVALAQLQDLPAESDGVETAVAAIEACGPDAGDQAQNGGDANGGDGKGGVEGAGNGDGNQGGLGHETCSEATQHALEVLQDLLASGKPVEEAISSIESCGTGADEKNGAENGGPPAGVPFGAPEGLPPEDVPKGPPEGVPPVDVPAAPPEDVPPVDPPPAPPEGLPPVDVPADAPEGVPPVEVPAGPPVDVPPA